MKIHFPVFPPAIAIAARAISTGAPFKGVFILLLFLAATLGVHLDSAASADQNANEPQPSSKPSERAAERAMKMKADIKNFTLDLLYSGDQDKPFYRLQLTVAPTAARDRSNPFDRQTQITEDQAKRIIDFLAGEGFLDKAFSRHDFQFIPKATQPGYSLRVMDYYSDLGWNLPMLKRLDGLRTALEGDAATNMDFLLGRLSGYRKQWTKDGAGKQ
ncbi:MAG TPA: hypothetical protein VFC46_01265 [Humisphaera sp.]|nr:hypothetical protein [Humisphaera sp.]